MASLPTSLLCSGSDVEHVENQHNAPSDNAFRCGKGLKTILSRAFSVSSDSCALSGSNEQLIVENIVKYGLYCIYVGVGQKRSTTADLTKTLNEKSATFFSICSSYS